jgi:hypothetical protein
MRATRLIRRVHMYAGLVFLPWVLLYGVTAFLFNHPTIWSRRQPLDSDNVRSLFQTWPTADALAVQAASALTGAGRDELKSVVRIENARYSGTVRATGRNGAAEYELLLRPDERTGNWMKSSPARLSESEATGFATKQAAPLPSKHDLAADVTRLSASILPPATRIDIRAMPQLRFEAVDSRGVHWDTTWNLDGGDIRTRKLVLPRDLNAREYLTRLHTTGQYPSNGAWDRIAWAVVVDAVFVLMVFWGASGIVMWWQQRRMRVIGAAILSVGAATAVLLGVALWRAFVS